MVKSSTSTNTLPLYLAVTGARTTSETSKDDNMRCLDVSHQSFRLRLSRDMIATGCEDKNVRVYYLATSSEQPLKVFTGHLAKVFHVRWSPLREGILCSGSDDG